MLPPLSDSGMLCIISHKRENLEGRRLLNNSLNLMINRDRTHIGYTHDTHFLRLNLLSYIERDTKQLKVPVRNTMSAKKIENVTLS